ncbi:hypothetical protein DV515_00013497, partial [Chloebia gouldiae]
LSGEAGSGLVGATGVKHPRVPLEQEEFRGLEQRDEELAVNKSRITGAGSVWVLQVRLALTCLARRARGQLHNL